MIDIRKIVNHGGESITFDGRWAAAAVNSLGQGNYGGYTLKIRDGRGWLRPLVNLGKKVYSDDKFIMSLAGDCYTSLTGADPNSHLNDVINSILSM